MYQDLNFMLNVLSSNDAQMAGTGAYRFYALDDWPRGKSAQRFNVGPLLNEVFHAIVHGVEHNPVAFKWWSGLFRLSFEA
ncbi:MAG: hypothetical protein VX392_01790 [Verrucomicrobiota bacterium]|nr:hypothetical protein [Verrucomicrobiota bacterium]